MEMLSGLQMLHLKMRSYVVHEAVYMIKFAAWQVLGPAEHDLESFMSST